MVRSKKRERGDARGEKKIQNGTFSKLYITRQIIKLIKSTNNIFKINKIRSRVVPHSMTFCVRFEIVRERLCDSERIR